jgi:hypothetical protein
MNNKQNSAATPIPEKVTLSRDLGLFTITMIGVGKSSSSRMVILACEPVTS